MSHWLASLGRLEALGPRIIVPSHGPIGDAGLIAGDRAYLLEIDARVATGKRPGRSPDQAIEAVTAAMATRHPDPGRPAGAIRSAQAEAP